MKYIKYPPQNTWKMLLACPVMNLEEIEQQIKPVLEDVRQNGDKAVIKYNEHFDKYAGQFVVSEEEILNAEAEISKELKQAIQQAQKNITCFHNQQKLVEEIVETMPGVTCWRKSVPIQKVGLYIPGGTAPLFSTVLMLGIPAQIAGCKEIILCTPANKEGKIHPAILYTAALLGIRQIYKIGGAQAIAAMAYGTEIIPQVYKIFGPGNQYVTAAKQLVNKQGTAIDMPAGPSEVAVWADETANPAFIAADLLSQAEHGTDSQVILVTTSEELIAKVKTELTAQLVLLPRQEIAQKALENSKSILVDNQETALALIDTYAPEHLIIACLNARTLANKVSNAGSVFIGNYTPESAGDYASGTNHTLPTNGFAKAYSGVSLDSFVKKITYQEITSKGLKNIGNVIEIMAEAEELIAHKNAVSIRLKTL